MPAILALTPLASGWPCSTTSPSPTSACSPSCDRVGLLLAVAQLPVLVVRQQVAAAERLAGHLRVLRVGDDVATEVQHLLEMAGGEVQQRADLARHVLDVPDVGARGGELHVPHAVATDGRLGDLDAAALAGLAGVALTAVLAAGALPVLLGTEDLLVEQAVALGLEGAVVDGLGLGDLAVAPAADAVGRRDLDLDLGEVARVAQPGGRLGTGLEPKRAHQCRPLSSKIPTGLSSTSRTRTSSPSEWSSFTSTLNDSGMVGSSTSSPLTIAS